MPQAGWTLLSRPQPVSTGCSFKARLEALLPGFKSRLCCLLCSPGAIIPPLWLWLPCVQNRGLLGSVSMVPKATLSSVIHPDSQNSESCHARGYGLSQQRIRTQVSRGKRHTDQSPGISFQLSSPVGSCEQRLTLPGTTCNNTHEVLPSRDVPLSLGPPRLGDSHMADLSYSGPCRGQTDSVWPMAPRAEKVKGAGMNQVTRLSTHWPRAQSREGLHPWHECKFSRNH